MVHKLITIVIVTTILGLVIFLLMFHPVNNSKENSIKITGNLNKIYEGGVNDICFRLHGDSACYYINRGLEQGLDLEELQRTIGQKEITIWYANYWSLFNIAKNSRHIDQLALGDSIIFTEW
ncbi:MAG TPA: hypothetical protein PL034_02105 [Candidatus Paceibacterota bacterium]|nr:hypothetical protein [Candidatus Paceibacterota bacterium]